MPQRRCPRIKSKASGGLRNRDKSDIYPKMDRGIVHRARKMNDHHYLLQCLLQHRSKWCTDRPALWLLVLQRVQSQEQQKIATLACRTYAPPSTPTASKGFSIRFLHNIPTSAPPLPVCSEANKYPQTMKQTTRTNSPLRDELTHLERPPPSAPCTCGCRGLPRRPSRHRHRS